MNLISLFALATMISMFVAPICFVVVVVKMMSRSVVSGAFGLLIPPYALIWALDRGHDDPFLRRVTRVWLLAIGTTLLFWGMVFVGGYIDWAFAEGTWVIDASKGP